ncbi:DeoR family transcriptional regulator, partial [Escherichia coli]|uniref:DeoR family transcriptional regulator n=1 Tax=Escherichia coli TaxID=562 RepID=UPI000B7EA9EA
MKFERHHEILKRLSKFGSVKVSDLSNSLNVTKETIRSDLNELARLGYLTRYHGGAGSDSNLLIVFYVQIMPDDLVMQLHR